MEFMLFSVQFNQFVSEVSWIKPVLLETSRKKRMPVKNKRKKISLNRIPFTRGADNQCNFVLCFAFAPLFQTPWVLLPWCQCCSTFISGYWKVSATWLIVSLTTSLAAARLQAWGRMIKCKILCNQRRLGGFRRLQEARGLMVMMLHYYKSEVTCLSPVWQLW